MTTIVGLAACGQPADDAVPARAERVHEAVMAYLSEEAHKITARAISETASREAWESVREQRLAELKEMLGLSYERPKTPLNVQHRGTIERSGYTVEKVAFESLPSVYVTANLYLPADAAGPVPAVIYVCGHAFSPFGAKTSYQRHGHTLARHGYAAMVIDPIQIAETAGLHHGVLNQEMYDWYTRAYSPAGLEVWNVIRALDYLETRPEVDSQRFAITGRSGGAAMSWFSAAVEPRIKAVVPIMGIGTYAVSVPDDTQRRHCDCMYPVNFRMHDLIHLGALIAPRPVFTAHGRLDPLFPVAGYTQFESAMNDLYSSYEVPDQFRNVVVESGHEDSDFLRAEAVSWLDKWLMQREPREIDTAFEEIEPADLAVFGESAPTDARNFRAHEFFIPAPEPVTWTSEAAWNKRRAEILKALREGVLHTILEDPPVSSAVPGSLDPPDGYESVAFDYAGHIPVEALFRIPDDPEGPALLHVAAPGEDPEALSRLLRNLRRFGRNPVLAVYPPGTGTDRWSKSAWKALLRNAMQTGRTTDTIRIGSVLGGLQVLRERAGEDVPVTVSGIGPAAGWALYAAALDESIAQAILIRAPSSHLDGPILLGAMRHADLPDIAALLAPRRLTFYGRMPAAFGRTRQIYEGLGVGDRLSVSMSIGAALNQQFGHNFSIGL
ncbi:MAG: acetylxylan esterase [Bryobacterales bacterium]|nr:acetylxylan esterase [Bryobacterales bacterium]